MKMLSTIAVIAALAATPSFAFFGGGHNSNANAEASQSQDQSQAQGQHQGQGQSQSVTNRNKNRNTNTNVNNVGVGVGVSQGNSQSLVVNEAEIPRFTGSASLVFSSMANDKCGRTMFGFTYSAHTCNVIMEAETMVRALEPVYGSKKAYMVGIMHLARFDETMRKTLMAAGIVKSAK